MSRFVERLLAALSASHDEVAAELVEGRVSAQNYQSVVGQLRGLRDAAAVVTDTWKRWGADEDDDESNAQE